MEFQQVFKTFAIILVSTIAIIGFLSYEGTVYNTNITDSNLSSSATLINTQLSNTLPGIATSTANATTTSSGGSTGTTGGDLTQRGLGVITLLPSLINIAPSILLSSATIIGIPQVYTNIAIYVFFFGFALLLAYMLIIGVRRLI